MKYLPKHLSPFPRALRVNLRALLHTAKAGVCFAARLHALLLLRQIRLDARFALRQLRLQARLALRHALPLRPNLHFFLQALVHALLILRADFLHAFLALRQERLSARNALQI